MKKTSFLTLFITITLIALFGVLGILLELPKSSFIIGSLCLVLSGFILVLLFRFRAMRRHVDELIKKIVPDSEVPPKDRISEINSHFERLSLIDRDRLLIRLMKDQSADLGPILEYLKHYDVSFEYEGFILSAFSGCRLQHMYPPRHFRKKDSLLKDLMIEAIPQGVKCYILDMEDIYVCMFNLPHTEDKETAQHIKKSIETFADTVITEVGKAFGLCTSASISELHKGEGELPEAYTEVVGLFEYRKITGNTTPIIHYTDYYVSFDSWYEFGNTYHKFEEVRRLITCIHVGDFTNAKFLINELIDNDYSRLYPSLLLARCRLYGIIDAAINAMGLLKEELDYDFLKKMDHSTRIVNCTSYSELQDELNKIFDDIINYYNSRKKDSPPEWFETIQQYIDTHYNDININVATIAEHFKISSAYYARVFKKYMGISPLDYIHKLRMRSAKRLMSKGVSVKDAASIVGYGNPITMSRAFKRYEGVTPGSYLKHRDN